MGRGYKRKTNRGRFEPVDMKKAVLLVLEESILIKPQRINLNILAREHYGGKVMSCLLSSKVGPKCSTQRPMTG